jgi:monofunctional glycosyltransferase
MSHPDDKRLDSESDAPHHQHTMDRSRALLFAFLTLVGLFWFVGLTMSVGTPPVIQYKWFNPGTTSFMRGDASPLLKARWRPLKEISPWLPRAVVAAEDDTFFSHPGYNWEAIKKAAEFNWKKKRFARGASTITMQVARNLFLSPHKSIFRKAHELLIALKLEREFSKDRILEIYLNVVEWGDGLYGAEAAARHYSRKGAENLSRHEAALLAAMLPRPRFYDRHRKAPSLERRAAMIEGRM